MFRILSDNPDLMENPHDEDSECDSLEADDSTAEEEDFGNVDDCNDDAPRTLNIFEKRRKIV